MECRRAPTPGDPADSQRQARHRCVPTDRAISHHALLRLCAHVPRLQMRRIHFTGKLVRAGTDVPEPASVESATHRLHSTLAPARLGTRRLEAEHHAKARTCTLAATCACTHVPFPPHARRCRILPGDKRITGADRYHLHDWAENAVRGYVQGANCSRHEHRAA